MKKFQEKYSSESKYEEKGKRSDYDEQDSPDSEEESENRVKMTKVSSRKRKPFYFSNGMPIKDRILIFKQDFIEFAGLDDEQTRKIIELYD